MWRFLSLLIICVGTVSLAAQAPLRGGDVPLKFKTIRKSVYELPTHSWQPVGTGLALESRLGRRIPIQVKGTQLLLDGDADGEFELQVEGAKPRTMTLTGEGDAGRRYSIAVVDAGGWKFRSACCLEAKIDGVAVRFFDQNSNGVFGDVGTDAVIIGRARTASFLSHTICVGGALYNINIDDQSSSLSYSAYTGDVGTLSVSVDTDAKVLGAVIRSDDGRYSFELSRMQTPVRIPAGNYSLYSGTIGLGENRVKVKEGGSPTIKIKPGAESQINWGGPVRADFTYRRSGEELQLSPKTIRYYGKSGEEYYDWYPDGKSPRITIDDGKTGRQIAEAYFPGTC